MSKNLWLFSAILFSLIIHLFLATLPGFKVDVDSWFGWAIALTQHPLSSFYTSTSWNEYTPGFLYVLFFLGRLRDLLSINPSAFYFILKLPGILSELLLGVLVFQNFKKHSLKIAKLGTMVVLFNPAFLFDSSVWGQIESILTLFLFLSLNYLNKNKLFLSGLFWALAFLIKPQAIALIPVFLFYLLKNFSLKKTSKLALSSFFTVLVLSLPFFGLGVLVSLPKLVIAMSNYYHYTSLFAYNLWGVAGFWINDSTLWSRLPYSSWGYLLFILYLIWVGFLYFRKGLSLTGVACLSFLAFYFLPTRVHERYLYPGLFLLLISALERKSLALGLLFSFLSLTFVSNLYFVYTYYNSSFYHLNNPLFIPTLFDLLESKGVVLSFFSTLLFSAISLIFTTNGKKITKA